MKMSCTLHETIKTAKELVWTLRVMRGHLFKQISREAWKQGLELHRINTYPIIIVIIVIVVGCFFGFNLYV